MEKVLISGGADGSDLCWGDEARKHGFKIRHLSFQGHRTRALAHELYVLDRAYLAQAITPCARAAVSLKRNWPPRSDVTRNLLLRNWWQIRQTGAVYATSSFGRDDQVDGGTAWAVQLYVDRNYVGKPLRLYLFDQATGRWMVYKGGHDASTHVRNWDLIERPPAPEGRCTGIGSRALRPVGAAAIRKVFLET